MKRISIIIAMMLITMMTSHVNAQQVEDVTLTVSSEASTKEEAVKNALRSAIEQTYGAFVSANTTILNDELVKDEIVTVSNGTIKDYKELASFQTENGGYNVTVQATVSLSHLISYSQSKGSECEFAGQTFGMAMKLFELEKANELKVLENLKEQIKQLIPTAIKYEIEIGEPKINRKTWHSDNTIFQRDNEKYESKEAEDLINSIDWNDYYTLPITITCKVNAELKSKEEVIKEVEAEVEAKVKKMKLIKPIKRYGDEFETMKAYYEYEEKFNKDSKKYFSKVSEIRENCLRKAERKNVHPIGALVQNVFESIRVTNERDLEKIGISCARILGYAIRNSHQYANSWLGDLKSTLFSTVNDFVIVDNTGQVSSCVTKDKSYFENRKTDKDSVLFKREYSNVYYGVLGKGLYYRPFYFKRIVDCWSVGSLITYPKKTNALYSDYSDSAVVYEIYTEVLIPKSEISRYSNFRVEPAH